MNNIMPGIQNGLVSKLHRIELYALSRRPLTLRRAARMCSLRVAIILRSM